jgi:hypothetical protein
MSRWTDGVKNHPVWKELSDFGPLIDKAASRWGIDTTASDGLARLRAVLAYGGKRLAASDPLLIDLRPLSVIAAAFASARAEVQAFATDVNPDHVIAANVHADDVLAELSKVASIETPDELTWLTESTTAYRESLAQHLHTAKTKQEELQVLADANRVALTAVATDLSVEKQKLSTLISEYQTQFSTAQDARASEYAATQADRQTKFAATLSELQSAFSAAQDARANEYTAAQNDRQQKVATALSENQTQFTAAQTERAQAHASLTAEYTEALAEHKSELTKMRDAAAKSANDALAALNTTYQMEAKKILEQIEEHKLQVEKLVGVIGNLGVTSGYQKIANRAQNALYLWQFLTVTALAGLILVAYIIAFAPPAVESLFLQGLSTRVFLSLTVGVFAAYAARQASNNMTIERRNRKLALELEALGPFIAPLPLEMQNKFRAELGDRSFGMPDGELGAWSARDPVTAAQLLPMLRETLTELVKRVK